MACLSCQSVACRVCVRPSEDIRALGPGGVFHVDLPLDRLTFRIAIERLEEEFAKPEQYVRLSDIVRLACEQEGAPGPG